MPVVKACIEARPLEMLIILGAFAFCSSGKNKVDTTPTEVMFVLKTLL